MKRKIKKLTPEEIETLKEKYDSLKFENDFDLFYEQQVPPTGIVVLDGHLAILKRKKITGTVEAGSLIGVSNLVNDEPFREGCKVMAPSELIMLNKSEILEALADKNSDLYAIIKDDL